MEEFYPSEIARLVLGYLKDAKCPKTWETFLEECSDLDEHSRLYKEGKFCSTNVNGKSLIDVLKEYCVLKREAVIENNQNKYARNTYEFEVLKTPNKANKNAFTTIRINQQFQSQSVVSSGLGQIPSPSSRSNIFRTPPSRPSGQTPRRRIECHATPLNFGPEAESCRTYSDLCNNKNANTSLRTPLRKKSSVNSRSNTCTSDSVLSVKSRFQERIVQNYANPNSRSYSNVDTTRSQKEHLLSHSSGESNIEHTNASRSQNKDANNSNTVAHSTQKEKIHNTFDYSDLVQFNDSVSASEKQSSQTVEALEEGQSTVLNKSYSYQSSEITKGQNVLCLENCFTPEYAIDPPPYNRAPFTNSPRIILSYDRSQIPSLTTPVKDTRCYMEDEWSPKRKGSIPRRRLITESPLSKYLQQPENLSFESMLEYMYGNEEELTNNPVVQLLTDNINKVKQNEMLKDQDGKKANEQDVNLENIVKSATELIEEDPILGKYFGVGLREEVNLNAELSAAKSCEVNAGNSEIESVPSTSAKSASDQHSNDNQDKNASHSAVGNTEESDLLVNALRETFGEITNPPHFSSTDPCIDRVNENNINNHDSFADDHEANVSTTDPSVNTQNSNNEVEGKNDVPDNSCTSTKQSSDISSNSVEKSLDKDCAKDKSDLSDRSNTVVDSVQITNTSEDLNSVKNSLEVTSNENVSRADLNNSLPSNVSNCEINQTSQPNASVINTQVANSAANVESSNIPCATTFITSQLPSQPVVEFPMSLPYFGLVQNGIYRIILNSPITWNTTPAGGLCTSTIPTADISSPLIFNTAPVNTVSNVENVGVVNTGVAPCNIGNFATPTIANGNQLPQFINTVTQKSVPVSPKKNQKNTKRKKTEKGDSPQAKRSNKGGSTASAKQRKKHKKRVPKREPLCLFPDSQQVENKMATPEKSLDNVPVLSIPETSSVSGQSSAFKLLSQITGQFEREERSPVLKMLMTNAAMLSQNSSRLNSSHVRCLDFGSNLNESTGDNGLQTNSKEGDKPKEKSLEKSPTQNRRSLRLQQSKEKQNLSQAQNKIGLKSKSPSPKLKINKRKRSLPKKRPPSTSENSTVDMTAIILNSMEEARQNVINARQTSENVPNKQAFCTLPSNQDSQKEVNVNPDEDVQMIDLKNDVPKNNEKVESITINQSISDPIVNDSLLNTEQVQKQSVEICTKEIIEECGNSLHNGENDMQEKTNEHSVTKGSDFRNSSKLKSTEKLTVSEPSLEASHSQTERKNSGAYESGEVNTSSNEKEDSEMKRTKEVTNEKMLTHADLSNYLFGSDSSSDESNVNENSNIVHEEPTTENISGCANITDKDPSISNHLEPEKGCLGKDKIMPLAVPDRSTKSASKAGINSIISPTKEKYPVINKENSAISNSKPFINPEKCDQLDGKSKFGSNIKKGTKELSEISRRKSQNSPSVIEGNSLGAKPKTSTVSMHIENSIAMKSDGEVSDSDICRESFCSYSIEDRKNCRTEINLADSDNQVYIESVDLCNPAGDSYVYPVGASKNSKKFSNECGDDIQLSIPKPIDNDKEKNTSKIVRSSTPKQAMPYQKRERTSSKNSKNINQLSKTGTSLEQHHELLDVTRSDNVEKKSKVVAHEKNISHNDKKRTAFSPDFIIRSRHVINDSVMTTKRKDDCLSPSAPCNVNKKDKQIINSDMSPVTNSSNNISKPLVPSSVTSDYNLVDALDENSSPVSNCAEREDISNKDNSHQTFKKSTKYQHRELKSKNSPLENNQSQIGKSPKTSDLLIKSVDLTNKVSCDLKHSLEVPSQEERKNASNKHGNSRSLNSAISYNEDKQDGSLVVENHKLLSTSSSLGHDKNVYPNSKDSMHEDYYRKRKDSQDYKVSHSKRERSFKNKSSKNVYQSEMLKNNDLFGREFNPDDTNKRNSSVISQSSNNINSSVKTSSQITTGSLPHTQNHNNQLEMIDKIDQSYTTSHVLAGKDRPSIEQKNKHEIHSDSRRSSQNNKSYGSQKSVDSKYPDKTYHNRREARERPHSFSGDKNNKFSNVKLITSRYEPKPVLRNPDRAKSSHLNVSKSKKTYMHDKYQRNSGSYFEVLKTSDYSRYRNHSGSVNSSKGNSKHTSTPHSTRDSNIRKDGYKNMSDSEKNRASSSKTKTEKSSLPSTASERNANSDSSVFCHSSTKNMLEQHKYPHSKKSVNFPKAQKYDVITEKSTSLEAKETMNCIDSSFQANNQELVKGCKKISDQETVSIHKENVTSPNKLLVPQDYFTSVDEQAQASSEVSVKSNNQSPIGSISAQNVIATVKSSIVSESPVLPQSDDSLTSISSKDGTIKINPPFKKRIRPIPVDTKSKPSNSPFPFCTGEKTVVTNSVMSPENPTKIGSLENSVVISSKKIQEKMPEQVDAVRAVSNPIAETLSSSTGIADSNSISPEKAHLPNSRLITPTLVTPTKEIGSTFVTPVKEVLNSFPTFISPISKSPASNPTTPNPKIKSVFRSPYPQSGKPKSMEYFYRKAFPDKKSDLPISPLSFSNSSCAVDAFSAKRQLLGEDSSSQLTNTLNVKNKTKTTISENTEESAENVCTEECDNQNLDGNETGEYCIVQKPSSKFQEEIFNNKGEQETGVYRHDTVKDKGMLSDILGRKRKRSESLYSDTCSTVVDCSDLEIMTPEKNDWLNKPLFSKDQSPMLPRKKKFRTLSASSDVTPFSSPEKEENLVSEPLTSSSRLFLQKNIDKSSRDSACNSSSMQDIHTENLMVDYNVQTSINNSESLFSNDLSPMLTKKKKLRTLSSSSDITPSSSPEKGKNLVSEPVCNSQLLSEKSLNKSSPSDIACNSSAMQDTHMENLTEDCIIQKSIIDSKKVQQSVKSISKTKMASHKSPLHKDAEPSLLTEENKSLSELALQDPKLNLLLNKIQILGLDNILDKLKDK